MTLSPWIIYLWGLADQIKVWGGICALASAFIFILAIISASIDDAYSPESPKVAKTISIAKKFVKYWVALVLVSILTPSSKTIAIMVVAPAIINSEPIQKDLPEIYQMAKDALKQTLKTE